MPFGTRAIEGTREELPEAVVELFVPLTDLGDPLFFVVLAAVVYWLGDHDRGAYFVGAMLLVLGLTVGLKELFALPRPPAELHLVAETGYGLPSGHAAGAVVVYGGLAALYDRGPRVLRYAVAAIVVALVSASRVVLGVHYVADVLAGLALGVAVLALAVRLRERERERVPPVFYAGGAIGAIVGAALSGLRYESSLLVLGGTVGALVWWILLAPAPAAPRRMTALLGAVVLPIVVWLVYLGMTALEGPLVLVAVTAVAITLVLATPHAAARLASIAERRHPGVATDR